MPKKQTKKKVEESEEEESEQSERSEEESEDKDSEEGSDDGSDKEEGSDEDSEKSDKSDDDESGSDKDSDDGSKSGSDDESKSGSDDEDDDSDEDSDDSGKKKKKKKGGKKDKKGDKKKGKKDDKKGKKDDKKGKGGEEADKKAKILAPISGPTPTLASVLQDLDDLSVQLAKTFPSFRQDNHVPDIKTSSTFPRSAFEDVRLQSPPTTSYGNPHHYHPPTKEELPIRSMRKPYSEPIFNADYKAGTYGATGEHKPLHRDISSQYDVPVVRNPSPEAVRAVNEYRQRKDQEKRGLIDRSVGSIHDMVIEPFSTTSGTINKKEPRTRNAHTGGSDVHEYGRGEMPEIIEREERTEKTGRGSQERTEFQDPRDYEYGMQRSRKNFAKSSQLAEDYYGHVRKISTSPQRKTLQDLYKHKPKPMYVESGNKQTVDRYHANAQSYGNNSNYRGNASAEKQGQGQNFRQTGSSYKHQNEPDNKRLINNAMEVLLKKSQNNYK